MIVKKGVCGVMFAYIYIPIVKEYVIRRQSMTPISGAGYGGFNPAELQSSMQRKFKDADLDESGGISKSEASEAMSDKGISEAAFDKMFEKIDQNGDGEVTEEEQKAIFDQMKERMSSMQSMMSEPSRTESASLFESLLNSLKGDQEDGSSKEELDDLISKLQQDPQSEEVQKEAANVISARIPRIDTKA